MDRRIKHLPIATDLEPAPRLTFARRLWQWLTPDTRMKRWTYIGLAMAMFSDAYPFLGILAIPMLIVSAFYYAWQVIASIRERLLWKVRNRILVSFVFVGVVPICLIILIGIIIGWFWIGTLGSNLLLRHVESTANRLDRLPLALQLALYRSGSDSVLPLSQAVDDVIQANQDLPELSIDIFERKGGRHELLYGYPVSPADAELPPWIPQSPRFAGIVSDTLPDGAPRLTFQAGAGVEVRDRSLYVLVSLPMGETFQAQVWNKSGVFISSQFSTGRGRQVPRTSLTADWSQLPFGMGDLRLPWGSSLKSTEWKTGDADQIFLSIWMDPVRIFNDAISVDQTFIRILLIVLVALCMGLACVEVGSFLLGLVISRRITTAIHELTEGTQALRAGDLDFRITTQKRDQLGELSRSFNAMTNSIQVLLREVGEKERIEAELAMAREVQARFIPKEPPRTGRLELVGTWMPARMVSGDYYDFIEHKEKRILDIVVSDISGKGMSAALMMAGLQAAIRSHALSDVLEYKPGRLSSLVSRLNQHLCHNSAPEKFATLFICAFDVQASTLTYCCAGHNPPFFLRNGSVSLLDVGGCPIGFFPDWKYEEHTIQVLPGDLFVIYTDGITEAHNVDNVEFGEEQLKRVIMNYRHRPCEDIQARILKTVHDFSRGAEQFDDQTVVVGRVQ
jgi:sigma-B regulation protein RsbU (phosphoserine phosphatase)